jgi:hypothetical protein
MLKKWLQIFGLACLYLGVIPLLTLVASFFSGLIDVGYDDSEYALATIGPTTFSGFPVWFIEKATGISVCGGFHLERFKINCVIWFLILLDLALAAHVVIRGKKAKVQNSGLKRELWHWVIDALVLLLIIGCIVSFYAWMYHDATLFVPPGGISAPMR